MYTCKWCGQETDASDLCGECTADLQGAYEADGAPGARDFHGHPEENPEFKEYLARYPEPPDSLWPLVLRTRGRRGQEIDGSEEDDRLD